MTPVSDREVKPKALFTTSDLIQQIRDYQQRHRELLHSDHFVFDCPLDPKYRCKPDYIWFGINPGNDSSDWARLPYNTEETRDYDFQEKHGRSKASKTRMDKLRCFLGAERFRQTSHCEFFFWGSPDTRKAFRQRYGYNFKGNPHEGFCWRLNLELIERVRPKAIFAEGKAQLSLWKQRVTLTDCRSHLAPDGTTLLEEGRLFEGQTAFYCFDHLSALGNSIKFRPLLRRQLFELLANI